jgi:hypothetical protein
VPIFPSNAQIGASRKNLAEKNVDKTNSDANSGSVSAQISSDTIEELKNIKSAIFGSKPKENQGMKLLGELLGFLRGERAMSALMACRQIKSIDIENGIAILSGDDDSLSEIETNEKLKSEIAPFFEKHGLGFKVKEKEIVFSDVDLLKSMLGSKLVIKN